MIIKTIFGKLYWKLESIPKNSTITFLNPYSYIVLRRTGRLNDIDHIGVDGGLLKVIFNLFLEQKVKRRSFDATSLAPKLFDLCEKNDKSIYFIGSTEKNIQEFINTITKSHVNLDIKGFRHGFFDSASDRSNSIDSIIKLNPDFVIVGMGSPIQEDFIVALKQTGFGGIAYTCGGYFHQTAQRPNYYPKFFNKYNLRWVYRILDEPKLMKRYFFIYPKSLFFLSFDLIKFKLNK